MRRGTFSYYPTSPLRERSSSALQPDTFVNAPYLARYLALEPRPQRQRHPPTVLTYNTLGNPTYETQAAVHVIAANSVSGSQLPQCGTPHLHWRTGLPTVQQFQLPS